MKTIRGQIEWQTRKGLYPNPVMIQKTRQMKAIAFKMFLKKGQQETYKKRHDEIWPELRSLLAGSGIRDYHIFLDEDTDILFAFMKVTDNNTVDSLPDHPVMQKWWAFMADIMETKGDNSPLSKNLQLMFVMAFQT